MAILQVPRTSPRTSQITLIAASAVSLHTAGPPATLTKPPLDTLRQLRAAATPVLPCCSNIPAELLNALLNILLCLPLSNLLRHFSIIVDVVCCHTCLSEVQRLIAGVAAVKVPGGHTWLHMVSHRWPYQHFKVVTMLVLNAAVNALSGSLQCRCEHRQGSATAVAESAGGCYMVTKNRHTGCCLLSYTVSAVLHGNVKRQPHLECHDLWAVVCPGIPLHTQITLPDATLTVLQQQHIATVNLPGAQSRVTASDQYLLTRSCVTLHLEMALHCMPARLQDSNIIAQAAPQLLVAM